jgi:hypothetical protein
MRNTGKNHKQYTRSADRHGPGCTIIQPRVNLRALTKRQFLRDVELRAKARAVTLPSFDSVGRDLAKADAARFLAWRARRQQT